ncbi:MAG: response regulator [Pseudomonadota bacterium]
MCTVLIAEDEPNIAEALRFLLTRDGYTVAVAGDGENALHAMRAEKPSLVILDVMLPKLDGFQVLKELRNAPDLAAMPVVMLTAKGQSQDRKTAEDIGVDVFVTKPFSNSEVLGHVRRLLNQ